MNLQERLKVKQMQLQQAVNEANAMQEQINILQGQREQKLQAILRLDGAVFEIKEQLEAEKKTQALNT